MSRRCVILHAVIYYVQLQPTWDIPIMCSWGGCLFCSGQFLFRRLSENLVGVRRNVDLVWKYAICRDIQHNMHCICSAYDTIEICLEKCCAGLKIWILPPAVSESCCAGVKIWNQQSGKAGSQASQTLIGQSYLAQQERTWCATIVQIQMQIQIRS